MIKKLKRKFNILVITSVFCLLLLIVGGMLLISFKTVEAEIDQLIDKLPLNIVFEDTTEDTSDADDTSELTDNGKPPRDRHENPHKDDKPQKRDKPGDNEDEDKIPDYIWDQNYFSITYDSNGNVTYMNLEHISTVDEERALVCATQAYNSEKSSGFIQNFRYTKLDINGQTGIIFLNCVKELHSFKEFTLTSLTMTVIGFIIVIIVTLIFSEKFTRPIVKNNKKQKQFITDAGHSLKTPLSVISANLDLLENKLEGNESFEDIRHQVELLTDLTNDLVYMARVEEAKDNVREVEFPISDLISETTASYKISTQSKGIDLISNIEPMLSFKGDSDLIKALIFILMDNAVKYSKEKGKIEVGLIKKNRQIILTVSNIASKEIDSKALPHVFDRFFRGDYSEDRSVRGYGIGLAKAKAIVDAHRGKINAKCGEHNTFIITVALPL